MASQFTFALLAFAAMATSTSAASLKAFEVSFAEEFLSAVSISHGSEHICSGVIMNKQWILTTAKCIQKYAESEDLTVSYGSNNRNSAERISNEIEKVVIHSEYEERYLVNNVAMLKTKAVIEFNERVQPAIWATEELFEDDIAYAVGWEKLNEDQSSEDNLKYYNTEVMGLDLCWDRLEELDVLQIPDNLVCTFGPADKGFPQLDIGSALLSEKNELIGVASWYEQDISTKVYAGVLANKHWIESIIDEN